jgi:hypothetical protein
MASLTVLLTVIVNIEASLKQIKFGHEEMMAKLDAHRQRMGASVNAW